MKKYQVAIIGAGSWGTAVAIHLARKGVATCLWGQDANALQVMQRDRVNQRYLPGYAFSEHLTAETDLAEAIRHSQEIVLAVPSHAFDSCLARIKPCLSTPLERLAWLTKGLDPKTHQLLHQRAMACFGESIQFAIISGPSFAKEVAAALPTAITLASNDMTYAKALRDIFHDERFRVYLSDDHIGTQLCGAVKNVLAIASGISDGLGYGANARAALITRGLAEMARLGLAMGADAQTFNGLAGMGDLVLTCTDDQSRNRRFGLALGQGANMREAELAIGQVVEGKYNAEQVCELASRLSIDMPVSFQVLAILEGKETAKTAVEKLLARPPTFE